MALLRVFHAIAEENSLTLAGNRLGLSQPAVSYAGPLAGDVQRFPLSRS